MGSCSRVPTPGACRATQWEGDARPVSRAARDPVAFPHDAVLRLGGIRPAQFGTTRGADRRDPLGCTSTYATGSCMEAGGLRAAGGSRCAGPPPPLRRSGAARRARACIDDAVWRPSDRLRRMHSGATSDPTSPPRTHRVAKWIGPGSTGRRHSPESLCSSRGTRQCRSPSSASKPSAGASAEGATLPRKRSGWSSRPGSPARRSPPSPDCTAFPQSALPVEAARGGRKACPAGWQKRHRPDVARGARRGAQRSDSGMGEGAPHVRRHAKLALWRHEELAPSVI